MKRLMMRLKGQAMSPLRPALIMALAGALAGCAAPPAPSQARSPATPVGIANPASVACVQAGGKLEIERDARGERGICVLPQGLRCDEWAWFRKEAGACCATRPQPAGSDFKACG